MKILILLIVDFLAILFFVASVASLLTNYKNFVEGFPKLFRTKLFLLITGFCLFMVIMIFAMGVLEWNHPIQKYERIMEPIYRLK